MLLYEADAKSEPVTTVIDALPVPAVALAVELAVGIDKACADLDELVIPRLRDWRWERIPVLDKLVLRLGTYELCHRPDVPTAVVLDEAVKLAKEYSGDEASAFVNGVLAAIAAEVR